VILKILMMTDLEGVSGLVNFETQACPAGGYYEKAKELLTGEVNAAVESLLENDVKEILVVDGHGAGGICFELLHPKARLLHGRPRPDMKEIAKLYSEYDAAVMIGQHSMAQTKDGCLNHTQSEKAIECYKLNGKYIGEIAQFALFVGAIDIPLIFLSGDEAACREAQELIADIECSAVKKGLNKSSAVSFAKKEAREIIQRGISRAVKKHVNNPIKPLKWKGPYVLEKRFVSAEFADIFHDSKLNKRINEKTLHIEGKNIIEIIYS
jgi:D-amino peptidase